MEAPMKRKRKNRAAVALAKRGNELMTPEQRSERARRAVQARWRKGKSPVTLLKPKRWYGLFACNATEDKHGNITLHPPDLLFWAESRKELQQRRKTLQEERPMIMEIVEYDPRPSGLQIVDEYAGDESAHVAGLSIVDALPEPGGRP
jgi:hypothetical protein